MWLGSCRPTSHALLGSFLHQLLLALRCNYQGLRRRVFEERVAHFLHISRSWSHSSCPRSNPTPAVIGPRITFRSHLEPPNHHLSVTQLLQPTTCVSSKSSKKKSTWCPTVSSIAATLAAVRPTRRSADTRAPRLSTSHHAHPHPMSQCLRPNPSRSQHRSLSPSLYSRRPRPCPHHLRPQVIIATAMPVARTMSRCRRVRV
jgi:hypothetical protein